MFADDDLDPKTKRAKPRNLDTMSIPELKLYIEDMKAEILRVEADIARKEKSKAAADALFKSS